MSPSGVERGSESVEGQRSPPIPGRQRARRACRVSRRGSGRFSRCATCRSWLRSWPMRVSPRRRGAAVWPSASGDAGALAGRPSWPALAEALRVARHLLEQGLGKAVGHALSVRRRLLCRRRVRRFQSEQALDGRHVHEFDLHQARATVVRGPDVAERDVGQNAERLLLHPAVVPGQRPGRRIDLVQRLQHGALDRLREGAVVVLVHVDRVNQRLDAARLPIEPVEVDAEEEPRVVEPGDVGPGGQALVRVRVASQDDVDARARRRRLGQEGGARPPGHVERPVLLQVSRRRGGVVRAAALDLHDASVARIDDDDGRSPGDDRHRRRSGRIRSLIEPLRGLCQEREHLLHVRRARGLVDRADESDERLRALRRVLLPARVGGASEELPVADDEGVDARELAVEVQSVVGVMLDRYREADHLGAPLQSGEVEVLGGEVGRAARGLEDPLCEGDRLE